MVNFEVVLSSGDIVNANINEHRDLWLALKGGSNNFGVVTRFDLKAFAQGKFWGGLILYPISTAPAQITAFSDFNNATNYDVYASRITSFAYASGRGYAVSNGLKYTKPVVNPPVFQPLTGIEPKLSSTMRISNLTDFTNELNTFNPNGNRYAAVIIPQSPPPLWVHTDDHPKTAIYHNNVQERRELSP